MKPHLELKWRNWELLLFVYQRTEKHPWISSPQTSLHGVFLCTCVCCCSSPANAAHSIPLVLGIPSVDYCSLPGSSEWCSKSTITFKSDPLNSATHCLLWACHRGVAYHQPAVASHFSHHPPHPSPPQVSSWWAELATHSRSCCSHWPARAGVCLAALRKC